MLFNTPIFCAFFAIFYVAFWLAGNSQAIRLTVVLVFSATFYGYGYLAHLWIVGFVIAVSFGSAKFIARLNEGAGKSSEADRRASWILWGSVLTCVAPLVVFKYASFLSETLRSVYSIVSGSTLEVSAPALLLPAGISFFTFQAIGYVVDVHRGSFPGRIALPTYASSIVFFPQLVAGPIVRAAELVPQLEVRPVLTWKSAQRGFLLICAGLFKKTIADMLAPISREYLGSGGEGGVASGWVGALAFSAQMYGDFCGYSDIAIGLSALCGYKIPDNFRLPYLATDLLEFWQRWHISLTRWMRDYIFFSLGTSRKASVLYRNLLITWLVTGIWHGARWNFVYWGLWHGLGVAVMHWWRNRQRLSGKRKSASRTRRVMGWFATMVFWTLGLTIFGAPSGVAAIGLVGSLFGAGSGASSSGFSMVNCVGVILGLVVPHGLDYCLSRSPQGIAKNWVRWLLMVLLMMFTMVFARPGTEFIYFEF